MAKGDAGACRRCGRALKSKESREAGIGPVCAGKERVEKPARRAAMVQFERAGVTIQGRAYFTREEARALLGRKYRATAAYAGVPAGTVGKVVEAYGGDDALGLDIQWQGIPGGTPHEMSLGGLRIDGFSRDDLFTIFTGGAQKGRRAMVPLDGPDGGPPSADYEVVQ